MAEDLTPPAALASLRVGELYRRSDLHALGLGGERQRGISYPAAGGYAFLFSNPGDSRFGYSDGWADPKTKITYRYSGMWFGAGPMTFEKGNAAVIERSPNLHLFIKAGEQYRYEGRFTCVDVDQVQAKNGTTPEAALLFELARATASDWSGDSQQALPPPTPTHVQRHPVKRGPPPTISADSLPADPEQRRLRLEKALRSHHDVVQRLSTLLETSGAKCSEDPDSYDLLGEWGDGTSLLVEAKSLHGSIRQRLRYAIGQLFEYRYAVRSDLGVNPNLAIATDRVIPDSWLAEYLIKELRMNLIVVGPGATTVAGPLADELITRIPSLVPQP